MGLKKPSPTKAKTEVTPQQADLLAQELANRPYGSKPGPKKTIEGVVVRTTISLPQDLFRQAEDLALSNKRQQQDPKSVSAIMRDALDMYFKRHPS